MLSTPAAAAADSALATDEVPRVLSEDVQSTHNSQRAASACVCALSQAWMLSTYPADWFIDSARPGKQVLEFIPGSIKVRPAPQRTHHVA